MTSTILSIVAPVHIPIRVVMPHRVPQSQPEAVGALIGYGIGLVLIVGWILWEKWRSNQ